MKCGAGRRGPSGAIKANRDSLAEVASHVASLTPLLMRYVLSPSPYGGDDESCRHLAQLIS